MKIKRSQIRKLIKEYEQYVDKDGNIYDDEGNVTRMGSEFGRRYGGGTYGTNAPWQGRRSRSGYSSRRKTTSVSSGANDDKIAAIKKALEAKPNKFLTSILNQLKANRGLSSKQNAIVRKILIKSSPEDAKLFERDLRRQLKRIIREVMDVVNVETGEVLAFGDSERDVAPDAALPDLIKRLGLNMGPDGQLSNADFDKLEQETVGKQDRRFNKKRAAAADADRERLNIDSLLQRLRYWAEDTARDYMADTEGDVELQDIAYDLADAWEFEFEPDEREELLWHFDGDLNNLKVYAAESM